MQLMIVSFFDFSNVTLENLRMTVQYGNAMRELCRNVERRLRADYRSDCRLALFGSAGNGFGLIGSDADICLRFASDTLDEVPLPYFF